MGKGYWKSQGNLSVRKCGNHDSQLFLTWSGKMGKHFPVKEKSGNCEQTGKVRKIYPEILEK